MQSDWMEFRVKQQQDAVEQILWLLCSKLFLCFCVWRICLDMVLGFSWQNLMFGSMSTCMVMLLAFSHLYGPRLRQLIEQKGNGAALMFQVIMVSVLQAVNLCNAVSMDSQLMQHRFFLSSQIVIAAIMCAGVYLPLWANLTISVPINITTWLLFHKMVGFWDTHGLVKATTFGVLVWAAAPILFIFRERIQWSQFRAMRELDREREIVEATQKVLRSMLSSLWDASCSCDTRGVICSSTPHLAQLFGRGDDLVGSCLCDFAANGGERDRLEEFLKNTAAATSHAASTLQFTAISHQDLKASAETYEVALYGIKLPPVAGLTSVHHHERANGCSNGQCNGKENGNYGETLFIGIKASRLEVGVAESAFATSDDKCGDTMLRKLAMAKEVEPSENLDCVESTADPEGTHIECTDSASVLFGGGTSILSEIPPMQQVSKHSNESGLSGETPSKAEMVSSSTQTEQAEDKPMPQISIDGKIFMLTPAINELVASTTTIPGHLGASKESSSGDDIFSEPSTESVLHELSRCTETMAAEYDPQEQSKEARAPLDLSAALVSHSPPPGLEKVQLSLDGLCPAVEWTPFSSSLQIYTPFEGGSTGSLGASEFDTDGMNCPSEIDPFVTDDPTEERKPRLQLVPAKVTTLRSNAPMFMPMGPSGRSSTDDAAQTSWSDSSTWNSWPQAEDGEGEDGVGGDAPPHSLQPSDNDVMLQLMIEHLGSGLPHDTWQLNSAPYGRLEYFLLAGGSLASLRSNLEGHRVRCEAAKRGDKVKILDMARWPMKTHDGRIIWSAESICQITRMSNPSEFEALIQDLGPPFQYGRVQLHCFMFEIVQRQTQ
jgi:hypothetical protein